MTIRLPRDNILASYYPIRKIPSFRINLIGKRVFRTSATAKFITKELEDWAETAIDGFGNIEILQKDGSSMVVAKEAFRENSKIFSLPKASWITLESIRESRIGPLVSNLETWLQFVLFLLIERDNDESRWKAYFSSLPKTLTSPAYWPEEELDSVNGSQLYEASTGYKLFFKKQYGELVESVFKKDPDLFDIDRFSFEAFCWAVGTVRSQIRPPLDTDQISLLPLVVNIGHSRDANVKLKLESGSLLRPNPVLSVISLQNINSGDTLLMDYGHEKLDNQLVLEYGVFDDSNPKGGYKLVLSIPEEDSFRDDKLDVLEVCGLAESPTFVLFANEYPSEDLLLFLRLLNLSGADAFHLEAIFRSDIKDHLIDPISEENEQKICGTMIQGCQAALEGYKSIPTSSPDQKKQSTYEVCLGEKQCLEWIMEWFTVRKENLSKLEYYAERRLKRIGLVDDDGNSTFEDMWKGGIA